MRDRALIIIQILGGLGLLAMGIKFMSDGAQKAFGRLLRKTLNFFPSSKFSATAQGFIISLIFQPGASSSVMIAGYLNSSVMNIESSIGFLMGANIGASAFLFLIALRLESFSLFFIGLGVFFIFFLKAEIWRFSGEIIFGFGLYLLGIQSMMSGFADGAVFIKEIDSFNIFWGVLAGFLITSILRSGVVVTGLIIALASQGLIGFPACVALVLGQFLGASTGVLLSVSGTDFNTRRAALAQTLFNVSGVLIVLVFFYPFVNLVENIIPGFQGFPVFSTVHIVMAFFLFNLIGAGLFIWFTPFIAILLRKWVPGPDKKGETSLVEFSQNASCYKTIPVKGIIEARKKLVTMAENVANCALIIQDIIGSELSQKKLREEAMISENLIDVYHKTITGFLAKLSLCSMSECVAGQVGHLIELSHYIEKYADHLENIAHIYNELDQNRIEFPEEDRKSLIEIFKEGSNFFNISFGAFEERVDSIVFLDESRVLNHRIKSSVRDAKLAHFVRVREKVCSIDEAIHFVELLNNMDGMRSQAFNIAEINSKGIVFPSH
jgi:phosphate:Na+ symporter